jgi:hypothetical protein
MYQLNQISYYFLLQNLKIPAAKLVLVLAPSTKNCTSKNCNGFEELLYKSMRVTDEPIQESSYKTGLAVYVCKNT